MSARAVWKGAIEFADVTVPVKLYSAIEDRGVSFRLLERKTSQPVRQALVNPKTDEVVEYGDSERGFVTDEGELVTLDEQELKQLEPESSRTIEVFRFVPPGAIEYRWYQRPYYLGPDGDDDTYFAFTAALGRKGLEGVARWVMRDKDYVGALRLHRGYPMLLTLRYAEEILPLEELAPTPAKQLDDKQLKMATQLIEMLSADFEPQDFDDEYRDSVLAMVEKKRRGGKVKSATKRRPAKATADLSEALEKSLKDGAGSSDRAGRGKDRGAAKSA